MNISTYIVRWLKGYVEVTIKSFNIERLLLILSTYGIYVWNVSKTEEDIYTFCIAIKDYRHIKAYIHQTHSRLRITRKVGFPFKNKYVLRKRYMLVGVICAFILVKLLSEYIWKVEIIGNQTHTLYELNDCLEQNNIYPGIKKKDIDCDEIEHYLRTKYFDITWASVYMNGTTLYISVKENTDSFISIDKEPRDIVTNYSGTVYSIVTRTGTPKVKPGDTVNEGDILVEGKVYTYNDNKEIIDEKLVRGDADIRICTNIEYKDLFACRRMVKEYTGKVKLHEEIGILGRNVSMIAPRIKYENYDYLMSERYMKIAGSFALPIYVKEYEYREYELYELEYSEEDMKAESDRRYDMYIKGLYEKGAEIIEDNTIMSVKDDYCERSGIIKAIMKIK